MQIEKKTETNKEPFFSILIPVYNQEKCLKRCMESVLNQTYDDIEIIIVDDASTDDSVAVEEEYAEADARVRLIKKQQNESLLAARITAMKAAHGRYVLFLDSDDYLSTDACSIIRDELEKDPVDVLGFSFCFEPSKMTKAPIDKLDEETYKKVLLGELSHTVWNKCYSSDLIRMVLSKVESFYCNMAEDRYFTAILLYHAKSYRKIGDVLYHYVFQDGMSTPREMSEESLEQKIMSVKSKSAGLIGFFSSEAPEYIPYVKQGDAKDIEYLSWMCCVLKQPITHRIKLLDIIDGRFETHYRENFEDSLSRLLEDKSMLEERSAFLEELEKGGFKRKARYACESLLNGIKRRFVSR